MNNSFGTCSLTSEQRYALVSAFNDIVMNDNVRNVNIEKFIKIIICESIFLTKYDALQKLANYNLI